MEQRVSLITLGALDVQKSTEFYEKMGWEKKEFDSDSISFFQLNGQLLGIYSFELLLEDSGRTGNIAGSGGISLGYNTRSEAEVAEILTAAEKAGGTITMKPSRKPWGSLTGYFADPDGHSWEVSWMEVLAPNDKGDVSW
mgnify:CR=1 FL=1